jgi:hypothetical protein
MTLEEIAAMSPEEREKLRKHLHRSAMLGDPFVQAMLRACGAPLRPASPAPKTKMLEPRESYGPKGWIDNIPLGPPPGVALCDRLMDAQDARDRADLIDAEIKRISGRLRNGGGW